MRSVIQVDDLNLVSSGVLLAKSDGMARITLYTDENDKESIDIVIEFVGVERAGKNPLVLERQGENTLAIRVQVGDKLGGALRDPIEIADDEETGSTLLINFRTSTRNGQVHFVYNIFERGKREKKSAK